MEPQKVAFISKDSHHYTSHMFAESSSPEDPSLYLFLRSQPINTVPSLIRQAVWHGNIIDIFWPEATLLLYIIILFMEFDVLYP